MTYVFETKIAGKDVVVEYALSSVTGLVKVVDMTVDGKFHRLNWMSDAGRDKLMTALDKDMEDRMCGAGEYSTEVNLERDMPYGL